MSKYPVLLAVLAAALFGLATPACKPLLSRLSPFQLAGLLYLGAAAGVAPSALRRGGTILPVPRDHTNRLRLAGAILAGGIAGPVLLLSALRLAGAASVSLWLNLELMATAVLGTIFFRDHLSRTGWFGVLAALAGAGLLSWQNGQAGLAAGGLVLVACACWGLDNHLTALIDDLTPQQTTLWKGVVAGVVNLAVGAVIEPLQVRPAVLAAALVVGALSYGISIVLYIHAAQGIGATRAQVVFSTAPLFGVIGSIALLHEPFAWPQGAAIALFAAAVALLLSEAHSHAHAHRAVEHAHSHRHDDGHHDHVHGEPDADQRHTHAHAHAAVRHAHPHWPDIHHRHPHEEDET
jgi:drug/metabolite transporter (DMT)-like permease